VQAFDTPDGRGFASVLKTSLADDNQDSSDWTYPKSNDNGVLGTGMMLEAIESCIEMNKGTVLVKVR
jgi:hypothetical protein